MESVLDWLTVAMLKALHIPFLAGWYIKTKSQKESSFSDTSIIGDNLPHVFLK